MQPSGSDNEKISAALEETTHEFSAGKGHSKLNSYACRMGNNYSSSVTVGLSSAVQESGADSGEPHESHELCLTKVVWPQEGVLPVVAQTVQDYHHGKLGAIIFSQKQSE